MTAEQAAPDVSIRARAPSPRRLSRKVLMGGALTAAAIVAATLIVGLSDNRRPRVGDSDQAVTASSKPPESISGAAAEYEARTMQEIERDAALPEAPWTDAERSAPAPSGAPPPASADAQAQKVADPEFVARTAPILIPQTNGGSLTETGARDDGVLQTALRPPRSRYELAAGSVIPASLLTALDSSLPGRVIAQVTAPVFDSATGAHLLIPQGAKLIGSYGDATRYGDERLVLSWQRLILPNGWSIDLQGMPGADPSGASGLRDRTDNHTGRLVGAVALSSVITVVANEAERDDDREGLAPNLGAAAAQEAARSGSKIVDRALAVRPTMRVRAGSPVRVLLVRDIRLRPVQQNASNTSRN